MKTIHVSGKKGKHQVLLYTLSTCGWCNKTKKLLKENDIEFDFVDFDLCSKKDQEEIWNDILRRGGRVSFPAIIIDKKILINGFKIEKIKEVLEI